MSRHQTVNRPTTSTTPPPRPVEDADLLESDLLVEEVSIDGMCGVY